MFLKIKRVWSHNDMNYIPKFKETFPELNKLSSEELCDRFSCIGIDLYTQKPEPVKWWVRITIPFALLLWVVMLIGLPVAFIIRGSWNYGSGEKSGILNWFRALKMV